MYLGSIFDDVLSITKGWTPSKVYDKEQGYRDDLIDFLRVELNRPNWGQSRNHSVQKESGRHLADIGIDRSVGVELKLNLKGKSQTDRLIGQVKGFLRDYHEGIIVVLCGATDRDSEEYLRDTVKDFSQGDLLLGNRKDVVIVVKDS